jgi:hypothetical protein
VVAAASNSVANSFKLTITKTNSATGKSTVETYDNVDSTRTDAAYWTALTAKSLLVAALVKSATGRPLDATYTLAGGTDGTGALAASDFVGTPGGGDKGIAVLETDKEISFFYCEDVPNSMRTTVNAAMLAHQLKMNDRRFAIFTGQSGDDAATAKTNAAALQTEMGAYIWQYGQVIDEDAASDTSPMLTMSLVGPFAALCSILQPHVSPATKRKDFTKALAAIKALVGGTSSSQVLDPRGQRRHRVREEHRRRLLAVLLALHQPDELRLGGAHEALRHVLDGQRARGVPQRPERRLDRGRRAHDLQGLPRPLVENRKFDPWFRPCLNAAELLPKESTNTQADIDAGDFTIGFKAKLISEQKRIILSGEVSTTVKVTSAAA